MKALGIDPGTHRVGWAVVENTGTNQQALAHGCLEHKKGTAPTVYLPALESHLNGLLSKYQPDILGIEAILFQKNVKTAISVAEARGVILLTAAKHDLPVIELTPNTIKSAVAGHGGANKKDVERMVGLLIGVNTAKLLDDETDALAVALCTLAIKPAQY